LEEQGVIMHNDQILILDFGSQVTQLIARRIRELNVYCEIHHFDISAEKLAQINPKGIILSGGPNSVYEKNAPTIPDFILELNIPILGICYGAQAITKQLGGEVESTSKREFGLAQVYDFSTDLFEGLNDSTTQEFNTQLESSNVGTRYINVWMSHGDKITQLAPEFIGIASSQSCEYAAIKHRHKSIFGVQFHPEVTHTTQGNEILRRFVVNICNCQQSWTMENYHNAAIKSIQQKVGNDTVILALSGGVDSSVAGLLIHNAIGKNLVCIFVDTGLLRLNEAQQVMQMYAQNMGLNIKKIEAKDEFLSALNGIEDPEQKRKIIGKLFVDIFEREASKIPNAKWLAQGTIYPDVIESAGKGNKTAHTIKSHHNVGGLPDHLKLKLLEPLRDLFKDEVRELGMTMGLPHQMVYRHPFPGPGLAVRILGPIKQEFIHLTQLADDIFISELRKDNLYDKVSQAFAVFIPVKTVGVMGDGRTYDYVISLRAVETTDFMTANVANLPFEFITKVANRIINEVRGINRVVYDISGKPPATIEWI
jgi:GMP synthase (glutamine-hydrolysing)